MSLPPLYKWEKTRNSLQLASQVLSAVRSSVTPPLPNALRLSLNPVPEGLSTGSLTFGGDLLLDFYSCSVVYRQPGEPDVSLPLNGYSQWTLAGALVGLLTDEGHDISLNRDQLADQTPLEIDSQTASDYAQALYSIFSAAARFRARLFGPQSPVVVWPHGFDLSFLWFSGAGSDEKQDPHLNFGFSPGSSGFERPYFYTYAYPSPDELENVPLPALAHFISQPWTGIVVYYDDLLSLNDPELVIEALFNQIYQAISPLVS